MHNARSAALHTGKTDSMAFPQDYGEDKFIIMMGALHTEMSFLKCLGNWLKNSG